MREALKPEELEEFAVRRQLEDFQEAVGEQALPASGVVSLKSSAADGPEAAAPKTVQKMYQRQGKSMDVMSEQTATTAAKNRNTRLEASQIVHQPGH